MTADRSAPRFARAGTWGLRWSELPRRGVFGQVLDGCGEKIGHRVEAVAIERCAPAPVAVGDRVIVRPPGEKLMMGQKRI